MSNRHYTQSDASHDRWYEFTVNVTLKINRGSFGIKYDRQGDFRFCAQSKYDAASYAGRHVKDQMFSIDVTRMIEIVGMARIDGPMLSDECRNGGHEDCNFLSCTCEHHSAVQFELERPLKSLREVHSEIEAEMEDAA